MDDYDKIKQEMIEIAQKAVSLSRGKLELIEKEDGWYQLCCGETVIGEIGPIDILEWSLMEFSNMLASLRLAYMDDIWDQVRFDAKELKKYFKDDKLREAYGVIFTIPGRTESNSDKE